MHQLSVASNVALHDPDEGADCTTAWAVLVSVEVPFLAVLVILLLLEAELDALYLVGDGIEICFYGVLDTLVVRI